MNGIRALFLSCLAIVLNSCAGTQAYKIPTYGVTGNVEAHGINYNKFLGRLISYSTINGRLKSEPDAYIEIARQGPIVFLGHKDHLEAAKAVLAKPCCTDGKTNADNIVKAVQWTRDLFDLDTEVQIEILLVPDAYNYQYATRYKIKGNQAKVRFAFHYYDERPVPETHFIESIVGTLTHELTHVYFKLSGNPAKNDISNETAATTINVCAQTLITQNFPITVSHISFVNADDEDLMPEIRKTEYHEIINKIKDDNPPTIIGQILATLIVEKIDEKYNTSDQLAAEKMREYCQHIIKTRHDFEISMGIDE